MRKTILIVNFLALCTLSLAANFMFSPIDTHAQSSQAADQQADRMVGPLAAPSGDVRGGRGTYFAVINAAGEVVRGTDVVGTTHPANGHFRVIFNADVSNCAYTATIAGTPFGPFPHGQVQVAQPQGSDPRQVIVYTLNADEFQSDRAFHLIVNCS
jgi:hypothetical protein